MREIRFAIVTRNGEGCFARNPAARRETWADLPDLRAAGAAMTEIRFTTVTREGEGCFLGNPAARRETWAGLPDLPATAGRS